MGVILAPAILVFTSPLLVRLLLPYPKAAIVLTRKDADLIKVFPEEIQMKLWDEKTLFQANGKTYRLGIKSSYIASYVFVAIYLSVIIVALGNVLAWFLFVRASKTADEK